VGELWSDRVVGPGVQPQAGGMSRLHPQNKFAVAIVAAVALLAQACGPAAPASTPAATSGAASKPATGEPIKIGYVWGVTGAVAEIVRPTSEGTRAYFDDLNKHADKFNRLVLDFLAH